MKNTLFLFLFLAFSIPVSGQNTFIPDDRFEQALIDLGLDDVLDDWVLTQRIDTVISLDLSWKQIDSLNGIQDFSQLANLNVGYNNLTRLDVSQNHNLHQLNCELNSITDLLLGDHPHLQTLQCRMNYISGLDLSGLPALKGINASDNNLSQLDVSQNTYLEQLICETSHLTHLQLGIHLHLRTLLCKQNYLSELDLSGLPALYGISVEDNGIFHLDCSHNPLLEYIAIFNNALFSINVQSNPLLKTLLCSGTLLTTLDISHNPLLNYFNCSASYLTELDVSQNPGMLIFACSDMPALTKLTVKNGNNLGMVLFNTTNNPELQCIEVDLAAYSEEHWKEVDSWSRFATDCAETPESEIPFSFYFNPATDQLHFSLPTGNIQLVDVSGRIVQTAPELSPQLSIYTLPQGIYFLQGISKNGEAVSIRFMNY